VSSVDLIDHYKAIRSRMKIVAPVASTPKRPRHLWQGSSRISSAQIQFAVSDYFGISRSGLVSDSRKSRYSLPRHVAMYLCRKLTKHSFPQIGATFNRHHTTVINSVNRVEMMMQDRDDVANKVSEIEFQLTGKWPPTYFGA